MLNKSQVVKYHGKAPDLVRVVFNALKQAGDEGIAPVFEGRICSMPQKPGQPCLAVLTSK